MAASKGIRCCLPHWWLCLRLLCGDELVSFHCLTWSFCLKVVMALPMLIHGDQAIEEVLRVSLAKWQLCCWKFVWALFLRGCERLWNPMGCGCTNYCAWCCILICRPSALPSWQRYATLRGPGSPLELQLPVSHREIVGHLRLVCPHWKQCHTLGHWCCTQPPDQHKCPRHCSYARKRPCTNFTFLHGLCLFRFFAVVQHNIAPATSCC